MASEIHDNAVTPNTEVDLSESVLSIIADVRADFSADTGVGANDAFGAAWRLWDRGDIFGDTTSDAGGDPNDGTTLISFNNNQGEMQAGDLVNYAPPPPFDDYEFTVRLYNDDAGVLFAADEVRAADSATPADSDNGEFYLLTTDWTTTDTLSEDVFGYEEPDCAEGFVVSQNGLMCDEEETPENETPAPARTESKVRDNAWTAFGGALAVGVLSYLLSDGTLLGYSATPDFGYSLTESGYAVNAGGRVDFRKDRWHLYWTAGQESVKRRFRRFPLFIGRKMARRYFRRRILRKSARQNGGLRFVAVGKLDGRNLESIARLCD